MKALARACACTLFFVVACAGPGDSTERDQVAAFTRFELVSGVLGARCGSLDCHGQVGRGLRVYSQTGLRLDAEQFPSLEAGAVSDAEILANYRSAIALEPDILALVVHDHGAQPERLTLLRKARGSESHKGGAAIAVGSAADRCILSWLASAVDESACSEGALIIRPDAGAPR